MVYATTTTGKGGQVSLMSTIADVARRAGVTTATVSNVLTGRVVVREETRERVLKAIAELEYRPNLLARGLAQGKTMTLALIVPTISNPFFAEFVEEAERVADAHDYQLLLCMTHNSEARGERHLERLSRRWVDGFIVLGMAAATSDVLALARRGKPVVLGGWSLGEEEASALPMVNVDFYLAGKLATQHLLDLRHRRIAAILELATQEARLAGYRETLAAAGLVPAPCYIQPGDSSFESGYRAALDLLALPDPPTAIFAGSDWMALGAIKAVASQGLSIPGDISIVGVDDIAQAAHARPPLTTIGVPKKEMARAATELLLERLANPEERLAPPMIWIDPYLVLRGSTACSSETDRSRIAIGGKT
jgi:DNA-binding LacI/PurR family transcriptional regulator